MKFRLVHRRSRQSPESKHAWSFGLRFGYWPCKRGPFLCLEFATHRIDMWFGLPSTEV